MDIDEMEEGTSQQRGSGSRPGPQMPNSEEASTPSRSTPSTSSEYSTTPDTLTLSNTVATADTTAVTSESDISQRSQVYWNFEPYLEIIAPADSVGAVSVSLHPLVILNISEHWTRYRVEANEASKVEAIGALIGKHTGRHVEIINSYELAFTADTYGIKITESYYFKKEQQYKQVFTDLDIVGWYRTGEEVLESDLFTHRQMCELIDSPLFLKLRPLSHEAELPISVFETVSDVIDGVPTLQQFLPIKYTLATEEAERVGIDHVARISSHETTDSSLVSENMKAQQNAIKMLSSRVHVIVEFVKATQKGDVSFSHEIIRQINSMSHRLPMCNDKKFSEEFYKQTNEVALMAYMAAVTKCCNTLNRFVNRFNHLHDRCAFGRRRRGVMF